jgi:hypothetical protein
MKALRRMEDACRRVLKPATRNAARRLVALTENF